MLLSFLKSSDHWWQSPQRCVLCHDLAGHLYLCAECADLIGGLRICNGVCPSCAKPSLQDAVCGECQRQPRHYDRLWASYRLDWPLHQLIAQYKFQRTWPHAALFGLWMAQAPPPWLHQCVFDAVIAMPLSRSRLHERGFNQAQLLVDALLPMVLLTSTQLNRPIIERQHRPPQSTLNYIQRQLNTKGIFQLKSDVNKRNLLLIDDVVTTTATLNELARILKAAGAASVSCWVLSRA